MQAVAQGNPDGAVLRDTDGGSQIAELYKHMGSLPPETQMFMFGCAPELEAKYDRIQARGLVMRNLFAFAARVQKTLYWQPLENRTKPDGFRTALTSRRGVSTSTGWPASGRGLPAPGIHPIEPAGGNEPCAGIDGHAFLRPTLQRSPEGFMQC